MYRMLVNHKIRLHITTNCNFCKVLLLLFQYIPNIEHLESNFRIFYPLYGETSVCITENWKSLSFYIVDNSLNNRNT